MPYMYSEMQNKLSKTRKSPFESMGQIISSRCPIVFTYVQLVEDLLPLGAWDGLRFYCGILWAYHIIILKSFILIISAFGVFSPYALVVSCYA